MHLYKRVSELVRPSIHPSVTHFFSNTGKCMISTTERGRGVKGRQEENRGVRGVGEEATRRDASEFWPDQTSYLQFSSVLLNHDVVLPWGSGFNAFYISIFLSFIPSLFFPFSFVFFSFLLSSSFFLPFSFSPPPALLSPYRNKTGVRSS